jgi:hypothetical protein
MIFLKTEMFGNTVGMWCNATLARVDAAGKDQIGESS